MRHHHLQRYTGKLLGRVPHWSTQCRRDSFMPLIPELERHDARYDVVAAVGFPFTLFAYSAWRVARRHGVPLILTPFLHLATPGDPVNRHYTRPHQIRLLREADLVVVVTELEAKAVEAWGIPRQRILVNAMGHEPAEVTGGDRRSYRRKLGIDHQTIVVGHLATLDLNKGTNDLVLALIEINAGRPKSELVHLVLAGVSSPHYEAFAATLPASTAEWLHQVGPLPAEDKSDFFAMLDVFSMPSRTDSFGIVFLESWANGVPVVAARAGGVAEVVKHGVTGLLVAFGDVPALARSIESLVIDPERRRRLGDAGRKHVADGYRWDDCFDRLAEAVDRLTSVPRLTFRPRHHFVSTPST